MYGCGLNHGQRYHGTRKISIDDVWPDKEIISIIKFKFRATKGKQSYGQSPAIFIVVGPTDEMA